VTNHQQNIILKEFKDFKSPENFVGGCMKSNNVPGFCVHLNQRGEIKKIEEGCKNFPECKGFNYKYHI